MITESFQKELIFLDKEDVEVMLRAMNGHPLSAVQMAALQDNYCHKGWVFMFCKDEKCSFVVPDEIREMMITGLKDEKNAKLTWADYRGAPYLTCVYEFVWCGGEEKSASDCSGQNV